MATSALDREFVLHELDVFDDVERRSAAMNMAVDEALLEFATTPSLRFYRWRGAAVSFGYFGAYADAAARAETRELVRRWTGGGIVPHGEDLTYSVILPQAEALQAKSARAVYSAIHGAIQRALAGTFRAELAQQDAPKISDTCFANPVAADVLLDGRKIAGAAQRRTRAGLLHQGSIQCSDLPAGFREAFTAELCPRHRARELPPHLLRHAEELSRAKYATAEWLRRR